MPTYHKTLDFSKQIASDDPELIDTAFKALLVQIQENPQLEALRLFANCLENRHLPMLQKALNNHSSLLEFDIGYNFEAGSDLTSFLLFLVTMNPHLKEVFISGCNIDDDEFKSIIEALLPTGAIHEVAFDFSGNNLTSKSADLAIYHDVNRDTLDMLKSNNDLDEGNKHILDIINEVLDGDTSKKSPILTAYLKSQSYKNCASEGKIISPDFKSFKLVK